MTFTIVSSLAAFVAGIAVILGLAAAVQIAWWRKQSFIVYLGPVLYLTVAITALASDRDFQIPPEFAVNVPYRPPVVVWFSRLSSLFLLTAAVERIVRHFLESRATASHGVDPRMWLVSAFLLMWVCTVLLPAIFGAVPHLAHDYVYTALIGSAVLLIGRSESTRAVELVRDAAMVFLLASVLVTLIMPWRTIDFQYDQGYLAGLPRFAGLAAHAVSLGMLALAGLLCLWHRPYRFRWMNVGGWLLALGVILMSQSKTTWIALFLCVGSVALVRWGRTALDWAAARPNAAVVATLLVLTAAVTAALSGVVAYGEVAARLGTFLATTQEGAQLTTLTGRDQIWNVALEEWGRNPVFGYGPLMFEFEYRLGIDMAHANHGHNQIMDTLARSGTVGLAGLTIYLCVLMYYSLKLASETQGLTLALMLLLILRAISEVPFDVFGYSPENIPHFTLLAVIAGRLAVASREAVGPTVRRVQPYLHA